LNPPRNATLEIGTGGGGTEAKNSEGNSGEQHRKASGSWTRGSGGGAVEEEEYAWRKKK
jgi:hypothetical protein